MLKELFKLFLSIAGLAGKIIVIGMFLYTMLRIATIL